MPLIYEEIRMVTTNPLCGGDMFGQTMVDPSTTTISACN